MTGEDYFYISSQIVREAASLGANVKGLVPPNVEEKLAAKFRTPGR
jgi:pantetheine-phosphate adenylyltransferase